MKEKKPLLMIHDMVDPNDESGRTYKEVNDAKKHKYQIGDIVEYNGCRAIVDKITRDCDGTPLYSLKIHGIPEECLSDDD